MHSPASNSPTRSPAAVRSRLEKWAPDGVHAKKDIHVSTVTTGKRMTCFLMCGLGTALLLLSCSGGSIRSSHASTESRVPKEAANQATGAVIADAYTPVVVSVLGPPTFPVAGTDMKYHIVYDLQFLNASTVLATLQKVEVVDAGKPSRVIISYEGAALVDRLRTLAGPRGAVQNAGIEPSSGRIFY